MKKFLLKRSFQASYRELPKRENAERNSLGFFWLTKAVLCGFSMIGLVSSGFSQEVTSSELLTLEEAIDLTLANNYDIKIERYNQEVGDNNVSRALAGQLPRLDLTMNYEFGYSDAEIQTLGSGSEESPTQNLDGTAQTFSIAPELSVPLFSGFRNRYRYKQLETSSRIGAQRVNQTVELSIRSTVIAYLEVARLQSQLSIDTDIIEISRDRYIRMVQDANYGAANTLGKLQAEVDLKTDSANYRNTALSYENSMRDLNLIMAQPPHKMYRVSEEILLVEKLEYEVLREEMLANNANLNLSKLNLKHANYESEIAKSTYAPSLSAYANYSYLDSENEANFLQSQQVYGPNVGIRMSWNLFNGGSNKVKRQNAGIQLRQQQAMLESTEMMMEKELKNVYSQYLNHREQLRIAQSNLPTYQLNYDKTSDDFKLGLVDASDVRTAQLNLASAKNRMNNLSYGIKQSEVRLLELSGRLNLEK
ncbi:MAG: TolC family protein [Bacteroidota bacterium]